MSTWESAQLNFERGLFRDALAEIRRFDASTITPSQAALTATLYQCTGELQRAEALAKWCTASERPLPIQAQGHAILGEVLFDRGLFGQSQREFQTAIRLSDEKSDEGASSLLRLLTNCSDLYPAEALEPLRARAFKLVTHVGKPRLVATFHLSSIAHESRRGVFDRAKRHLELAQRLLEAHHNVWLEGALAISSCVLNALLNRWSESLGDALRALECSKLSGYVRTELAALTNLSHVHVALGQPTEARKYLKRGLELAPRNGYVHSGLLDSWANAELFAGNTEQALSVLTRLSQLQKQEELRPGWSEITIHQTIVRAALARGDTSTALEAARQGLAVAEVQRDSFNSLRLRLLQSGALVDANDVEAAATTLGNAAEASLDSPEAVACELQLALGKVFRNLGFPRRSGRHLERARIGARTSRDVWTATRVDAELANRTSSSKASPTEDHASVHMALDSVAAVLDLSGNPELIGREAFALLQETGACTGLALVARRPRRGPEILASHGWDDARAAAAVRASGPHAVLLLGQRGDRSFDLIVEPATDLLSRCTVVAIRKVVAAALSLEAYRRDERQRASLWPAGELEPGGQDIVASAAMLETLATARKVAPLEIPVLITGETGTGKEMLARAIHRSSPRAARPFLPFNCTAIPREMIESQLFGYRRGAFTGAQEPFPGVIRAAAGGTLFLDEIGDLPLDLQPKLLRFLDTHEIHPLGEPHPIRVDVRVVAATNANLDEMVGQGRFREDLFYRINVIRFQLPPLRERREEIPPLARHFLQRAAEEFRKGRLRLSDEAMEYLLLYRWPGNVRHLANEIQRMAALAEPDCILEPSALSAEVQASRRTVPTEKPVAVDEITVRVDQSLPEALETIERHMVRRALERSDGRFEEAARLLGISRKGLFLKRRRWGVQTRAS